MQRNLISKGVNTMANPTINHIEYRQMLEMSVEVNQPLLITGKPGIGKTYTGKKFCVDNGYDLITFHPAVDTPQDYKGLGARATRLMPDFSKPIKNDAEDPFAELLGATNDVSYEMLEQPIAEHLAYGQMLKILEAKRLTIVFFDDLGQAPTSVLRSEERRVGKEC